MMSLARKPQMPHVALCFVEQLPNGHHLLLLRQILRYTLQKLLPVAAKLIHTTQTPSRSQSRGQSRTVDSPTLAYFVADFNTFFVSPYRSFSF